MTAGSILAAILVLAIVIFVHELGHFLAAKWCDVEVRVFSMGFGPTVLSRTYGETDYRLALIPLGGYVRMAGHEEDGEEDPPLDPSRGFTAKPLRQRALIVAAGPLVNLVFAALVFGGVAYAYGASMPTDAPRIGGVLGDGPAREAGLQPGDTITAIDSHPIATWDQLSDAVLGSEGHTLSLVVRSAQGESRTAEVTPKMAPRHDEFGEVVRHTYVIGIGRDTEHHKVSLLGAAGIGVRYTGMYSVMILETFARLIQGRLSAGDLGGPILIAREAGRQARTGLEPLLMFMALISINLGIINVLPVPVLDGGHLAFMGFEAVRGRPLSLRVREGALQVGMVLIGALMIFVVCNDIFRIVTG